MMLACVEFDCEDCGDFEDFEDCDAEAVVCADGLVCTVVLRQCSVVVLRLMIDEEGETFSPSPAATKSPILVASAGRERARKTKTKRNRKSIFRQAHKPNRAWKRRGNSSPSRIRPMRHAYLKTKTPHESYRARAKIAGEANVQQSQGN